MIFLSHLLPYAVIQELNRLPQQLLQLLGNRLQGELGIGAAVGAAKVRAQDHGPEDTRIKVKYLYFLVKLIVIEGRNFEHYINSSITFVFFVFCNCNCSSFRYI